MNKRQNKKRVYASLPKNIKDLVRRYSSLHFRQDYEGGIFTYSYNKETKNVELVYTLTEKTANSILSDCKSLFTFTRLLMKYSMLEYSSGDLDNQRAYRIEKHLPDGFEAVDDFSGKILYFVKQSGYEDYYQGTIYIPLQNHKYLAFDYNC